MIRVAWSMLLRRLSVHQCLELICLLSQQFVRYAHSWQAELASATLAILARHQGKKADHLAMLAGQTEPV